MPDSFADAAHEAARLHAAIAALERVCGLLQIPPLEGREWYELLTRKLLPQLAGDAFIVAAVVGGTNIGKSVIFNHLAGCRASATSPLASGTRHPVCLVPPGFSERHDLGEIFQGFELHAWSSSEAALEQHEEHRLFWRVSEQLPPNLLVLDTPDIDSDSEVNWHRADCIRHCADVLIAVLTQQKYNDAAVKKFFRKAAAEDKAIVIVFNQCLLPEDEPYWPLWLETFSRETGIRPDLLYLSPNDRRAAEQNALPFFQREWPPGDRADSRDAEPAGADKSGAATGAGGDSTPQNLSVELSGMHFPEIKMRTLRGSLRHLVSPELGVPGWLTEIRNASASFKSAADLLSTQQLARIDNWPSPPNSLLVEEIRNWWRSNRQGLTRTVHDLYGTLGQGLTWPFRWVNRQLHKDAPDPRVTYRRLEWDVVLQAVNSLYDELTRLSELGNDLLRPRLERLISGGARAAFLKRLSDAHAAVDLDAELQRAVTAQMQSFTVENPNTFGWLKRLDSLAALARPVTSVAVFFAAAGPVGHAIGPMVTDAAAQSIIVHVAGDVAGGTGAVVVGETAITGTAGGLRMLEARFRQLQTEFTAERVAWFARFLKENLLGELQQELETAANLPESELFRSVRRSVDRLAKLA